MMIRNLERTPRYGLALALVAVLGACGGDGALTDVGASQPGLDQQVRAALNGWGVVPILPVASQNPAIVDLGRSLFFDRILSGNRDVSCASCHNPENHTGDGLSLAVGTHGRLAARNAPALFSVGLGGPYLFWDGRVSNLGPQGGAPIVTPLGSALPAGVTSLLAAQAMLPVTNRVEMRGNAGDADAFGNANELAQLADTSYAAIWSGVMRRVLAVSAYMQKFNAAYPLVPAERLGFEFAANAIAAFETETFTKAGSPFDHYLAHDDGALATDAKQGALLFFGKARCSQCHNGPLLGGQQFASVGVPQLGPGSGSAAPLDIGAGDPVKGQPFTLPKFFFRVAPLRNVELSAPYMHDGAYPTLEAVVRHYNNVDSALKSFDVTQLDASLRASYRGDAATVNALLNAVDGRLRQPLALTPDEQRQLVAFLKSLTDPGARDLHSVTPSSVPSGLPVR
jgi:cytochrome c peroxidase